MKNSKRILSFLFSLCMLFSITAGVDFSAFADETWIYDDDTKTLTISGTGEIKGFSGKSEKYSNEVENLVINEGITSVGGWAFYDCSKLENVSFPNSLESIRTNAFRNTSIKEITIPKNVNTISKYAFCNDSLEKVNIYSKELTIDVYAFYSANLCSVNIDSLSNWCSYSFGLATNPLEGADLYLNDVLVTDLIIPNDVTTIEKYAFRSCISIETVRISEGVKSICSLAFASCENLKSVYIPSNVSSIAKNAFSSCYNLTDIYFDGTKEEFDEILTSRASLPDVTVIHYLKDHEHNFKFVNIVEPTCTSKGYTFYKCSICGDECKTDFVEKLDHNYITQIIEPTCSEKGYTIHICTMCSRTYKDNYVDVDKLNHYYIFEYYNNSYYNFECCDCNQTTQVNKDNLPNFDKYINSTVIRGNNNMYLDLTNDGVINAKDYAKLLTLPR